jgi:hypothetical protein
MLPDNKEPTQEQINKLASFGFIKAGFPYHKWVFKNNGLAYDLSAADLNQLEEIKNKHLFIVSSMSLF